MRARACVSASRSSDGRGVAVQARILIVDQDVTYGEWVRHHLGTLWPDATVQVLDLAEFERASESLTQKDYDLLMLAASFGESPDDPQAYGLELLRKLRGRERFPAVIALAENGNELTAVRALQLGAVDYLPKRLITPQRLKTAVRVAMRRIEQSVARRIARLAHAQRVADSTSFDVAEDPDAAPRDFVPGYEIQRIIGESEKAVVYLAKSVALGHDVALKVSRKELEDDRGRQRLAREYAAISAIRHPGIVRIFDYGVHAGREYLAMEYFPRGNLKARIQQGITESEALRYLEEIASALRVVHRAGILHRDLKPPNVMLRENDQVVLIDFGLARNVSGNARSTRTGVLRGSPYYMSPEQAQGEELDARTDLYSLGIIFFEMLTGRKPYTGGSAMEVLQQHVNAEPPRLSDELAHHQELLARLVAKSRDERFASADELLAAIASVRAAAEAHSTAA